MGRVGYFGRRLSPFIGTPAVFSVDTYVTRNTQKVKRDITPSYMNILALLLDILNKKCPKALRIIIV
jgi:hypothetical protein